jgi:hypothetical protein
MAIMAASRMVCVCDKAASSVSFSPTFFTFLFFHLI